MRLACASLTTSVNRRVRAGVLTDLRHLGVQALAHLGAAVVDLAGAVGIPMNQCARPGGICRRGSLQSRACKSRIASRGTPASPAARGAAGRRKVFHRPQRHAVNRVRQPDAAVDGAVAQLPVLCLAAPRCRRRSRLRRSLPRCRPAPGPRAAAPAAFGRVLHCPDWRLRPA